MRIILLSIIIFSSLNLHGQYSISGRVADLENTPLPYVNVILLDTSTRIYLRGEVTKEDGTFTLDQMGEGTYLLECSYLGYKTYRQKLTIDKSVELSTMVLDVDDNVLDEVSITAKKPLFERKSDRTIVNVQNAITSAGSDVLQILERSPGIQVDRANHAISLMGKSGVIVAINGKRSRLDQQALLQMLASTPSGNIKRIELITNPPASYDADGDGGVINIVMIKNQHDGFNGNLNAFVGMARRGKYGGGINFNLNRGKLNIYGDISTNNDYADHDVTIIQRIEYPDAFIDTRQHNDRPNYTGNHAMKLGFDLQISDQIDYGFFVRGMKRDWKMDAVSTTQYFTPLQNMTREVLTSFESNETDHYMLSNHLGIQLNTTSSLTFDYDYLNYEISNPTDYGLKQFDVENDLIADSDFVSDKLTPFDFHVIKTDLETQLSHGMAFQIGAKATLSSVTNDTRLTYLNPNPVNDPFFTDIIDMDEQIIAGYTSLSGSLFAGNTFSAGIRYEDYQVALTSSKEGGLINRRRGRFYPTLSMDYTLAESKTVSLSYNERVNRPGFQVLAPAFYFFDVNTVLGGNVRALPTISRTATAGINLGTFFISVSYTDEDEPISWGQPTLNDGNNILILRPQNTPDRDILAATLNFPLQITSFWSTQWNFNLFHRRETALIDNSVKVNAGLAAFGNLTQTFALPNSWEAEISTRWNSSVQVALANFKPRVSSNIGIGKKFKNESRLSFNWNDIFNLGSFFGMVNDQQSQGVYYDFNYNMEGNVLRLAYSVPFGNTSLKIRDKHTSGSAEEQQRAQN